LSHTICCLLWPGTHLDLHSFPTRRSSDLSQVEVGSRQLADLEMLAIGAYSPLRGFMTKADYLGSVNDMHLSNGLPWSIPITLSRSEEHTSELQSPDQLVCRLLHEKKKKED